MFMKIEKDLEVFGVQNIDLRDEDESYCLDDVVVCIVVDEVGLLCYFILGWGLEEFLFFEVVLLLYYVQKYL